jgi:NDP-sugar pyrophosphorylase family protein
MRAIILAGGRGTRLAPYTTIFPKPLMPIGEIPIIEIIIRQLRHFGFKRVTLAVGYLSELLRAYIENNHRRLGGIDVDYIYEEEPTGTAGSLAYVSGLDGTFLVMNGDVLTTLDYAKLIEDHHRTGATLTIATYRKPVKIDLGVIETNGAGNVCGYHEKPELDYFVSMGIYVYEASVLRYIPKGQYLDFPDLVKRLLGAGEQVHAHRCNGYWLDIGRAADFQMATDHFAEHHDAFNVD